jgi:uncharacterized protein YjbI with pentapeptide repeats
MTRADLTAANFSGADITGLEVINGTLRAMNFRNANLTGVNMNGADDPLADFNGAIMDESFRTKLERNTK